MEATLEDLRATMADVSADGPENLHRIAEVRRRIKRGNRARLAAVATLTAAAVTAGTLTAFSGGSENVTHPDFILSASDPAPDLATSQWGMPRIAAKQFTTTGRKLRHPVHPHRPGHARRGPLRTRLHHGSMGQWDNGTISMTGNCQPRTRLLPGATSLNNPGSGVLRKGKPAIIEVAILHGRAESEIRGLGPPEIEQYVAQQQVTKSTWSIGVYSGACAGPECPRTR